MNKFKTVFFAFTKNIKLLNMRLVFPKWIKKYLKLEFVLVAGQLHKPQTRVTA